MSKTPQTIIDTTAMTPPGYQTTFRVVYDPAKIHELVNGATSVALSIGSQVVVAEKPWTAAEAALNHMRSALNQPGLMLYPTKIVKRGIAAEDQ